MARFILFLLVLVPIVFLGNWLVAHPGMASITWLGYNVEMHVVLLVSLLGLACLAVTTVILIAWQLAGWPARRRARSRYRTLSRGLSHLTHGVTALALGDEKAAEASLRKAMIALPHEPLPQLLNAQMLQRQGQHDAARTHLRALLKHDATSMLASKRLIEQHTERQEWDAAIALAEQTREETPRERWLLLTLIDLYARTGNARSMLALTEGFQWQSPLSRDERNHFAALAYYLQSQSADNERHERTALRHAVGYAPDFLPALIDYARVLMRANEYRQARKWLLTAWASHPRSLLIDPILQSMEKASPRAQERLLRSFLATSTQPSQEHALLRAAHAMAQSDAASAEAILEESIAMQESREACSMMADAVKMLRGDEAGNRWLSRAIQAPASEAWICNHCCSNHGAWQAHCRQCGTFDTLHYQRPEERITSMELATA